jgi:hypothetical protein
MRRALMFEYDREKGLKTLEEYKLFEDEKYL